MRVLSKLKAMPRYQLIVLWFVGALEFLVMGLAFLPQKRFFVLIPMPNSFHAMGAIASGLWNYAPGFTLCILATILFTIAMIVVMIGPRSEAPSQPDTTA